MTICPICNEVMEVIVHGFHDEPFIDGRNYNEICFTCASVPKRSTYNKKLDEYEYHGMIPDRLATVEELVEDGWSKEDAKRSIKAVKRILRNPKTVVAAIGDVNIFDVIMLEIEL